MTIPPTLMVVYGKWHLAGEDHIDEDNLSSGSELEGTVNVVGGPKIQ
jgi:hypothetical protein